MNEACWVFPGDVRLLIIHYVHLFTLADFEAEMAVVNATEGPNSIVGWQRLDLHRTHQCQVLRCRYHRLYKRIRHYTRKWEVISDQE